MRRPRPGTTTTMSTDTALLRLLTWFSPAFPTGAFAHSHGIESAVEDGLVTDEAAALAWIATVIRDGAPRSDAILLRHAHAAPDATALAELARLAEACAPTREMREESRSQGIAFIAAARAWGAPLIDAVAGAGIAVPHPVAAGALARAHGIDVELATLAFAHGFAASLVSAALRLVPLGQTAALRIQHALEPAIAATAAATRGLGLDDLGTSALRVDVAFMRHETQRVRLFRT